MATVAKKQRTNPKRPTLYEQVMAGKPLYKTNAEAANACRVRLEEIASKFHMTVSELLNTAETTSGELHPEYSEALMLERRIAKFSRSK